MQFLQYRVAIFEIVPTISCAYLHIRRRPDQAKDAHMTHIFSSNLKNPFAKMAHAVATWNEATRVRAQLSHMTDRELADIGLIRADIERVARGA